MAKKSLDRKKAKIFIIESRKEGKTDQEIYKELTQQYYDKRAIILMIKSTISPENKKKFKNDNNILIGLLVLIFLLNVIFSFLKLKTTGYSWNTAIPWLFFLIYIVCFIYAVIQYNVAIYRIYGIMSFLFFIQIFIEKENIVISVMNLSLAAVIAVYSIYLEKKMFPDYKLKNLKKDENGDYILN